ncbi:MAG TPA: TIGR01777 family protein [Verrucomicrobia bacterium]|nr:MAG: TIGR01777 family protein [Lentisphaerae bacterium GWF2_57_35]HBA84591.1 TIGR01777 family protein [Verrucomicrobiota bacterium]
MKIAISGAGGFIGSTLTRALSVPENQVLRIVRTNAETSASELRWNPATGTIDRKHMEGIDAVVHLAGENIVGRWTQDKKNRIRDSRVLGTRLLVETLAGLTHPPKALICASATGYYGDRRDEVLTEKSSSGRGFLAEVCSEWEEATTLASAAGIRVVMLRFGLVLSGRGGGLPRMLLPFRLGLGGPIGGGQQYVSWITLVDAVHATQFALEQETLSGPVNVVAPQSVTQREFARTLGNVLSRPAFLPIPAFIVRGLLGDMGQEVLLNSARVAPNKLTDAGFQYEHPVIENALQACCQRPSRT